MYRRESFYSMRIPLLSDQALHFQLSSSIMYWATLCPSKHGAQEPPPSRTLHKLLCPFFISGLWWCHDKVKERHLRLLSNRRVLLLSSLPPTNLHDTIHQQWAPSTVAGPWQLILLTIMILNSTHSKYLIWSYSSPPLSVGDPSPRGCLKPRIVLNPI